MMKKRMYKLSHVGHLLLVLMLFLMSLLLVPCHPCHAAAVSDEVMEEVRTRIITAVENNEIYVDLSDLNIQVNMYADRFSPEYQEFLDLADDIVTSYGCYDMGTMQVPFCRIGYDSNPSPGNTSPYGTGANDLLSVGITYDYNYFDFDEKPDKDFFDDLKTTISENYKKALSTVDPCMSDVEKALVLYDYIIAASNYPDNIGYDEEGNEDFEDKYHAATNLFYEGIAVCSGNAEAYVGLLRDSGIRAVVVESLEMNHEWVMLEIEDEWFHADPTWDNPRYEYYTECYDDTDDPWDLGAAAHYYFLKSDEEIEELYHYGWDVKQEDSDLGITELPAADHSGAWDDDFFSEYTDGGNRSRFNYIDGVWYFLDRDTGSVMLYDDGVYSKMEQFDALADGIKYVHGDGTYLFCCANENIFAYEPATGKTYEVISAADYGEGAMVSEMRVVADRMDAVILTAQDEDGDHTSQSVSAKISELKFEEVNEAGEEDSDSNTEEPDNTNSNETDGAEKKSFWNENRIMIIIGGVLLICIICTGIILFKRKSGK